MIWTVCNSKGGTGKTTTAIGLASALAQRLDHEEIVLFDADPQGTAQTWYSLRDTPAPFTVIHCPDASLEAQVAITMTANEHTAIIIDAPPRGDDLSALCIKLADLVITPAQASSLDAWSTDLTIRQRLWAEEETGRDIPHLLVHTRARHGLSINRAAVWPDLPLAETILHERVAHVEALSQALTVHEYQPHGLAALELNNLATECATYG